MESDTSPSIDETDTNKPPETDDAERECVECQARILEVTRRHLALLETCLAEVDVLLRRLQARLKSPAVNGLSVFIRGLQKEQQTAQRLVSELTREALSHQALKQLGTRSDNCVAVIARSTLHWDILKRCRSFVAISQTFQGSGATGRKEHVSRMAITGHEKLLLHRTLKEQGKVTVDVVNGGYEWVDLRTLQADRLARQMTDSGWGWGEHEVGDCVAPDEWEDVPLAKQVRRLVTAARMNRHEYRFPRVRVVLPNLSRESKDVEVLLDQLSRMDSHVEVVIEDRQGVFMTTPPEPVDAVIERLLGDEFEGLTSTLNLDHTILIDLISDLTHLKLESQPSQAVTTRMQIEEENRYEDGHMVSTLYPVLQGRELVCTREAAEHFHEVLRTVGTDTERQRGKLLVPWDEETRCMTISATRKRFQALSTYPLPLSVQVPVRIPAQEWTPGTIRRAVDEGRLPRVALDVMRCGGLTSSKLSIYLSGWAGGLVTVTSNKEVGGQMRTWVEGHRKDEEERGPAIWKVNVTRNLLGKNARPREGVVEADAGADTGRDAELDGGDEFVEAGADVE